jgi:hypothetical protein
VRLRDRVLPVKILLGLAVRDAENGDVHRDIVTIQQLKLEEDEFGAPKSNLYQCSVAAEVAISLREVPGRGTYSASSLAATISCPRAIGEACCQV